MKIIVVSVITISYVAAVIGIKMMDLPVPITILLVLITIALGGFGVISLCSQRRSTEEKIRGKNEEEVQSTKAMIS